MMQINEVLFVVLLFAMLMIGIGISALMTYEYRKSLDQMYKKKHSEIYKTIQQETKDEWSKGWDAAYDCVGKTQKAYHLWFKEHGYKLNDIEEWLEDYLKKP